jgi:hypothetical protein
MDSVSYLHGVVDWSAAPDFSAGGGEVMDVLGDYSPPKHCDLLVAAGRTRSSSGSSRKLRVLLDLGAATTFVGAAVVEGRRHELRAMSDVRVVMPTGATEVTREYLPFRLELDCTRGQYSTAISAVYMPTLENYDVVLGLDWFISARPTITWGSTVSFEICGSSGCGMVTFEAEPHRSNDLGSPIISHAEFAAMLDAPGDEGFEWGMVKVTPRLTAEEEAVMPESGKDGGCRRREPTSTPFR